MSAPTDSPQPTAKPRNRSRVQAAVAAPLSFGARSRLTRSSSRMAWIACMHRPSRSWPEIGVEFRGDDEALSLWRKAGAKVEGVRVRFEPGHGYRDHPEDHAEDLHSAWHDREPLVEIGGDAVVFAPAYGSPFVYDREKGRRYGSLEDFKNFVKMTWMSPWLHHSGGTVCEPVDVPVNKRHLDMVYAHIKHSAKPFMGSVTAPERAEDSMEMCRILFGADFVDKNCVILGNINTNSPLIFDGVMSHGPARLCPRQSGGRRGALHPRRRHGPCDHCRRHRPGPCRSNGRCGTDAVGTPGRARHLWQLPEFDVAAFRRAHFRHAGTGHGLSRHRPIGAAPGRALAVRRVADRLEGRGFTGGPGKRRLLWPALLGGANFILHAAGWLEGGLVMGYVKFILDCDHLGMMHKLLAASADDDALAMDAFREVEPGKHFLGCAHTMANYQDRLL